MKRMLTVFALLAAGSLAATTIHDIQYTTDPSGDSPMKGQVVTVTAEVTGEPYAYGGSSFYIQDANAPWSGINVYDSGFSGRGLIIGEGDSITITGTVDEYHGKTELTNITSITVDSVGVFSIKPQVLTTGELADSTGNAESWEGVLVQVKNVDITNPDLGNGEWSIDDGSGDVKVDDAAKYYFWQAEYANCLSVTGPLDYTYSQFKIIPRLANDIIEGHKIGESKNYTRIQRIQQVRYSDLLRTPTDVRASDSYMSDPNAAAGYSPDSTITVYGVVTMPTGLSYAGAGVKFMLADLHGGPWSAIMSYNSDASVYPNMTEGYEIEMSGYVGEYFTSPSAMTEYWLVGDVEVKQIPIPGYWTSRVPEPPVVKTSDLRWPTTAEQWENVYVTIQDAWVSELNITNYVMGVNDGSGQVLIVADSDSLRKRGTYPGDPYVAPPMNTPIESITGWVYHHYGSYADSTAYGVCPNYKEDIVLGEGPAMILKPTRTPAGWAKSTETVDVSATISTVRQIVDASVYYRVDGGDYTAVAMTEGADDVWTATLPAQAAESFVDYYYSVTDDSSDISLLPADITTRNYSYLVLDRDPSIYDIQYTDWATGASPLTGAKVKVTGVVQTASDPFVTNYTYGSYSYLSIADAAGGPWNGIFLGAAPATLSGFKEGDLVDAWGSVTETMDNAYWRWENNTTVQLDSIKLVEASTPVTPVTVTTGTIAANPEAYEGTLVRIETPTMTAVNQYDCTIDNGDGGILLDDDAVAVDSSFNIVGYDYALIAKHDTVKVNDQLPTVTGVFIYSYGTFKIEVRKVEDFDGYVGIRNKEVANHFKLHQNYPNPFNPTTTLAFDLPSASHVTLVIYSITGQKVKTLTNREFTQGYHTLVWDGHNEMNEQVGSGIYLYRLKAGDFTAVRKMTFIK